MVISTKHQFDPYCDDDEDEKNTPMHGQSFPVYRMMGTVNLTSGGTDGPLVAMAKVIQDDAESGGSYIMRLGEHMTVTIAVEVTEE